MQYIVSSTYIVYAYIVYAYHLVAHTDTQTDRHTDGQTRGGVFCLLCLLLGTERKHPPQVILYGIWNMDRT
jgi:hypothetical protein